jgi:hypothetical protein
MKPNESNHRIAPQLPAETLKRYSGTLLASDRSLIPPSGFSVPTRFQPKVKHLPNPGKSQSRGVGRYQSLPRFTLNLIYPIVEEGGVEICPYYQWLSRYGRSIPPKSSLEKAAIRGFTDAMVSDRLFSCVMRGSRSLRSATSPQAINSEVAPAPEKQA